MTSSSTATERRGFKTKQAAQYLGLSYSWLTKARIGANKNNIPGPEYVTVGRRCIYRREDLDRYLDNPPPGGAS